MVGVVKVMGQNTSYIGLPEPNNGIYLTCCAPDVVLDCL